MGTPFITLLEPSKLDGFRLGAPLEAQPPFFPKPFLDAMEVRTSVFIEEQKVPADHEFDIDDPRSCHWIVYASVNKTEELEVRDEDGNIIQPRKSSTRSTPVGTIRLVPFPHEPHPRVNGRYWDGVLEGESTPNSGDLPSKTFAADRQTSFHDGREPYVKLGRLAVVKEFRGNRLAGLLVKTALSWLKANQSYFDPSITELGLEQMGTPNATDAPKWGGLVCVHAQESVIPLYARWGFKIDEGMGKWWEEGILHVGMFLRLDLDPQQIRI